MTCQNQGEFRHQQLQPNLIIGATKWCVFENYENITRLEVVRAVRERMERMQTSRVDHLQVRSARWLFFFDEPWFQFHWQHYSSKKYLFCLNILRELQQNALIASIGLCNFDSIRTDEICTELGPGVITTNQVQVSPWWHWLMYLL